MGWLIAGLVVVCILVAFFAGKKYGLTLESNAYARLIKLETALHKTGVSIETYFTGDLKKIKVEAEYLLSVPARIGTAVKTGLKAADTGGGGKTGGGNGT